MHEHDYIRVEDVRFFMMDRTPEDNDLIMDLEYSDDDILQAMRGAARAYNSIPPFISEAKANELPANSNLFLHGIAMYLYMATNAKLKRNDIDYTAGGVSTNIVSKRIEHLDKLIQFHKSEFDNEAKARKIMINLNHAFGPVG